MTEEQFSHLSATLHQAIDDEIEARIGKVVAVTEEQLATIFGGISQELSTLDDRTDTLARKLADVTAALVAADGSLAQRVEGVERLFLDRYEDIQRDESGVVRLGVPPLRSHASPKRRGLLSRLTRRTLTHQGAGPEGTE